MEEKLGLQFADISSDFSDYSFDSDSDSESDCEAPPYSPVTSDFESSSEDEVETEDEIVDHEGKQAEEVDQQTSHSQEEPMEDDTTNVTYSIVGDNIDKSIRPRYMRVDTGNQLLHYFHYFAALDRVDVNNFSSTPSKLPTCTPHECALSLLPSVEN